MASELEDDLSCSICLDIFKDPVILSCCHSFCRACVEKSWKDKASKECPLCKKRHSKAWLPPDLPLKILCEKEQRSSEILCNLHHEKLRLFCLDHQEPVCHICRDSKKHSNHRFIPINEAAEEHKKNLEETLVPLKTKLKAFKEVKEKFDLTEEHIGVQAQHTQRQVKEQFKKLHQFLEGEEEARLRALKEEEEQKRQKMKVQIEALRAQIADLSQTVRAIEDQLTSQDIPFLKNYKASMERVQQRPLLEDPQLPSGTLIDQAKHLGNLGFNIWTKMKNLISYTPVILDPNTSGSFLILSDDLTTVRGGEEEQQLPDNPERFDLFRSVQGSVGFNSGTHIWDVQVGDCAWWSLGVIAKSVQRREDIQSALWRVWFWGGEYRAQSPTHRSTVLLVKNPPKRIRVNLDSNRGKLLFTDPDTNTLIHSFKHTFTHRMIPYFETGSDCRPLKVLQAKISVTVGLN